jgi:hypothetical protein
VNLSILITGGKETNKDVCSISSELDKAQTESGYYLLSTPNCSFIFW